MKEKPTIIIAAADYRTEGNRHLRALGNELDGIKQALKVAENAAICNVVRIFDGSVEKIMAAFDEAGHTVVGFHFAGHADGYGLLLKASNEISANEFAEFLGKQPNLKFIFLNACSTLGQVESFHKARIPPLVIATDQAIRDKVAQGVAVSFYEKLGQGRSIKYAFGAYTDLHQLQKTTVEQLSHDATRGLVLHNKKGFPWELYTREGSEHIANWSLGEEAEQPLFGLPPIPDHYRFPPHPFRGLERFQAEHARLFFGRGYDIKRLHDKIMDPFSYPILLMYGESGVGKSSLLEAGLCPRLEETFKIEVIRRDHSIGLDRQFLAALEAKEDGSDVVAAWQKIEKEEAKPLLLILDQVEEYFTVPMLNRSEELPRLFMLFQNLFPSIEAPIEGRVLLTYRKEYHPDIEDLLHSFELLFTTEFIQKLEKRGIVEAVCGLTSKQNQKHYNGFNVEEELPNIIADDLLVDRNSTIAPVLQILLTKLWEGVDKSQPYFSVEQYNELQREGILLSDFIEEQMKSIQRWNNEVVSSGLLLDLLMFHTTPLNTADKKNHAQVVTQYSHQSRVLSRLLEKAKSSYLLNAATTSQQETTYYLAHDTLAPIIRALHEQSDLPGQRADRVLRNNLAAWQQDRTPLNALNLEIAETGRTGMRAWQEEEEEMVRVSKAEIKRQEQYKKRVRWAGVGALLLITILSIGVAFVSQQMSKKSRSGSLMSEGELLLLQDPTQGIAKMISGWQLDAKEWTKRDKINRSYLAHTFYEEVAVPEKFEQADISSDGRYLLLNQGLETSMLYEMREKKWTDVLDLVGATTRDFNHLAFSKDNQYVLSAGLDHKLNLWSTQGDGQLEGEYRPSSKVNFQCAAISKDNQYLVGGTDKGMIFLWKRNQPEKFDTIAIGNEEIPILAIEIHPNEEQILVLSSKAVSAFRFDGTLLFQKGIDTENGFSGKLALSTDASKLAYISGRTLEIYNWKDDSTTTIPHELILDKQSSFQHLCFSNDGNLLFVADNQQGYLLSASKNQASVFRSLKSDKGIVTNATFSKDDQQLYTIHQEQQQILKWAIPYDAPQLLSIRSDSTCELAQNSPVKAAYTTEGDNIVVAYRYGALLKYYLTSDDCQVLTGHENSDGLRDMLMSPNGQYVLSWHNLGFGEALYLWDKNKQTAAIQLDMQALIADDAYLQTLAFSPTQSLVLIGTDQNAFLYDYIKQEKKMDISLEGIQKGVFSADGNSILLVTNKGELKTWQEATNTLETYENIRGATALAVLEENRFASASNDTIFICEIGIVPTTIPLQKPGVSVNEIHYLAASQELLLLSVFEGKSNIEIWSIEGYPCRQLLSLDAPINSITLSPDKSRIVAVSEEGQLYFWDNNYPNIERYLERFDK